MSGFSRTLSTLICVSVLSACAVGNTYNYDSSQMILPVQGPGEIGLAIIDIRPYVLSGDKPASFVGLQRGGFGNPFDVKTTSGQPLSQEMHESLARRLESYGFSVLDLNPSTNDRSDIEVMIGERQLPRNLLITFDEWKTDAMASFGLSYNVTLQVLDAEGTLLASNRIQGTKERLGGAGFEGANSLSASRAFASKMNELFSQPEIIEIMQSKN